MTPEQRTAYWSAAIEKAREAWPNDPWGIALNSTERRSQCHMHLHIGKLLPNLADEHFIVSIGPPIFPSRTMAMVSGSILSTAACTSTPKCPTAN